jgi:hypothetical protein
MKSIHLPFIALGLLALCAPSLHGQINYNGVPGPALPAGTTNIGIGLSTPLDKLDVSGAMRVSRNTNYIQIATPANYHTITTTGNLGFTIGNNAQISYTLGGSVRTTMLANGNVGIGTAAPNHRFHVHNGAMMVSGSSSLGGAQIAFSDDPSAAAYPNGRQAIEYIPNVGLNFWRPWNPNTGGGVNYNMLIKDDGKIGVGLDPTVATNFPNGYRLYVKDGILTEKLKVALVGTAGWADYVFDADYKRNTLAEVETFVKANHHLPNVPSATEVSAEGIDMVEMDATLLRQIEELWLHMIDLEKENKALRTQIDQLR